MKRLSNITKILIMGLGFLFTTVSHAKMTITHIGPKNEHDLRFEYDQAVLDLALKNTIKEYGEFEILRTSDVNYKRAMAISLSGGIENFVFKQSASNKVVDELGYVNFPVDLGIVGYRVLLSNKKTLSSITRDNFKDKLKSSSFLQGIGWLDVEILEKNGLNVVTGPNYVGLFKKLNAGHADFFPRGANEILNEWNEHSPNNPNLALEKDMIIYYPLPRFFVTNKKNTKLIERITLGLKKAYNSGELQTLWKGYYNESLEFVDLENRQVVKLENPFISNVPKDFEKYIYSSEK